MTDRDVAGWATPGSAEVDYFVSPGTTNDNQGKSSRCSPPTYFPTAGINLEECKHDHCQAFRRLFWHLYAAWSSGLGKELLHLLIFGPASQPPRRPMCHFLNNLCVPVTFVPGRVVPLRTAQRGSRNVRRENSILSRTSSLASLLCVPFLRPSQQLKVSSMVHHSRMVLTRAAPYVRSFAFAMRAQCHACFFYKQPIVMAVGIGFTARPTALGQRI
jgi:hypothetical protein